MAEKTGRERRLKPRYNTTLPCSLALPRDERDILFPREEMECRTRDLSESGVGLHVTSIYLGYACVLDEGRTLELSIELPAATVRMTGTTAHYLRTGGGEEGSYVVGLRILSMSERDRAAYLSYLEALASAP
ncbi:MAG TPA: PilZ domain-containing protein [Pyrinomonadaceae bacterium]|nr:PilZ domain-containing protein [Pyrinomonadaceae bacterium]